MIHSIKPQTSAAPPSSHLLKHGLILCLVLCGTGCTTGRGGSLLKETLAVETVGSWLVCSFREHVGLSWRFFFELQAHLLHSGAIRHLCRFWSQFYGVRIALLQYLWLLGHQVARMLRVCLLSTCHNLLTSIYGYQVGDFTGLWACLLWQVSPN